MDFSKDFGKVSHSLLIHKLQHDKITGQVNPWIRSFLDNRRETVVMEVPP